MVWRGVDLDVIQSTGEHADSGVVSALLALDLIRQDGRILRLTSAGYAEWRRWRLTL